MEIRFLMSPLKGVVVPSSRPRRKASTAWGYTDLANGLDSQSLGAPSVRILVLDSTERLLSEIYCSRLMAPVQQQWRPRTVPQEGGDQHQSKEGAEAGSEAGEALRQRQQEDEEEGQQARSMTLLQALLRQVSKLVAGKPASS